MRIGKRILSVVLALVMVTTMLTGAFYSSAVNGARETVAYEGLVTDLLGDYVEGDKLVTFIDEMVNSAIEGKIFFDESDRKIIKGLDESITAGGDAAINDLLNETLGSGEEIIQLGDEKLLELINTQEVLGVPIMQLRYVQNWDALVSTVVLADNSDVLKAAVESLKVMFPDVEPTYESIISCLIPILSAFNFGEIMANMSNVAGALQLASPTAFAYMAGIDSELLTPNYLQSINTNLTEKGYRGTPVEPLITLDAQAQETLLGYVAMEKAGESLGDIAAAGFNWTDFAGNASKLELANAFIKIALGDADKLGAIAESPAGPALVNLLCDLLNDLQDAPVSTLLAKISDAEGLAKIADFALSLLNGYDSSFKSYDLFFTDGIFYDGEGNTTFYDYVNDEGNVDYKGPKAMDQYLPVIAAGLDFLDGIAQNIETNEGDLLRTLFVDRLPQLENVVRSAISYTEGDNEVLGLVAYFLDDYKTYLQANNALLSNDVLISLAQAAVYEAQDAIKAANAELGIWQGYVDEIMPAVNAKKLEKAKELGVFDASVEVYSDEALDDAIAARIAFLQDEIETLTAQLPALQQAMEDATAAVEEWDTYKTAFNAYADELYGGDFYDNLSAILGEQDAEKIAELRDACADDFNAIIGAGKFDELASLITEYMADFEGDPDGFIENMIFGSDGIGVYDMQYEIENEYTARSQTAADALSAYQSVYNKTVADNTEIGNLETGAVKDAVIQAGNTATMHIFYDAAINVEGDFTLVDLQDAMDDIENKTIAGYAQTIALEEAKIEAYQNEQNEQQAIIDTFDLDEIALEQEGLKQLLASVMVFLGGDENVTSLYDYFQEGKFIEMIAAPDRVDALRGIVDNIITLFAGKLPVLLDNFKNEQGEPLFVLADDYLDQVWLIEEKLFGEGGVLSNFYTDFTVDPIISIVSRIAPLASIIDNLTAMGLFTDILEQYAPMISVAANLFGDANDGFIAQWNAPYADGSVPHHYINAVMSLLPKIVNLYDEAKELDQIAAFVEPYQDIIELGLGFITEDFYNRILSDGFMATILDKDVLKQIVDFAKDTIEKNNIENKDFILALLDSLYDNILKTLYDDLKANPAETIADRSMILVGLARIVAQSQFDFEISEYDSVVNVKMFRGLLSMIPEEYQDLIPQNIVATVTLFVRTLLFSDQYLIFENDPTEFDANTYFYFNAPYTSKYVVEFAPTEGTMTSAYFNGTAVKLLNEDGKLYCEQEMEAGQTYELCIDTDTCPSAVVTISVAAHEHEYEYTVTTAPDCEKEGVKTGTCKYCGDTITETIPATGHDWGEWTVTDQFPATCTEAGISEYRICKNNEAHYETKETPALGHDWSDWNVTKAATCEEAGSETRTCSRDASHTETQAIPALGHDWSEWNITKAATCEEAGSKTRTCSRDASHTETVAIPALGHDYKAVKTAPTAVKAGFTTYTCANCGNKYKADYTAPTGKVANFKCKARTANAEALIWNKVSGAVGYQVQISNPAGTAWVTTKTLTANTFTFTKLTAGSNYKFRVRFYVKADDGKYYFSAWTALASPTLPQASAIAKLVGARRAMTVQWKKIAGVGGYQIQYANNAKFAKAKTVTVKGAAKYTQVLKSLAAGKYYVRVRTYKTINKVNYFSAWSAARAVAVKK